MSLDAVAVAATARADATWGHASSAGAVMRVIIRSRQQRPVQLGGRTDHMLAVIQHQQQPAGTPASESATGRAARVRPGPQPPHQAPPPPATPRQRTRLPQVLQVIGPRYREDLRLDAAAPEDSAGIITPIDPR